jgi:hypothetical protein
MGYLDEKAEMLNALGGDQWAPSLSVLDSVLGSLTVGGVGASQ